MKQNKCRTLKVRFLFIIIVAISYCTSCAVQSAYKKVYTTQSEDKTVIVDSASVTMALPSDLSYESIYNEQKVEGSKDPEKIKKYLDDGVLMILNNKGLILRLNNQNPVESESYLDELNIIKKYSESMFRAYIDSTLKETVKRFGEKSKVTLLMLVQCKVKVGSGGTWDSYSGAITSQNNRTVLTAVLLRTSDCSRLWTNTTQLRKMPKADDIDFDQAINSLFTNLKLKRNG